MKKVALLALIAGVISFVAPTSASARVAINVGFNDGPGYYQQPAYYDGPVYYSSEYPHYRYHSFRHHHHHH